MQLFDATSGQFIATNGTVGHEGGDSVWITHQDVNNLPDGDLGAIEYDLDILRERNDQLLETLVDRSLKFMTFSSGD